jgi:hypothetical protein
MAHQTSLKVASYASQKDIWPKSGNHILAQFDDNSIIVYQAYSPKIAKAIVRNQNFHSEECIKSGFSMDRMTWIKTNFLWMMFRSGWGSKQNQECILAITITRTGFEEILSMAISSSARDSSRNDQNSTKVPEKPKRSDEVRLQWDPDHFPNANKVEGRKAIQLGLRGKMVHRLSNEFIIRIEDITEFVLENKSKVEEKESEPMIPVETVYNIVDRNLARRIGLTQ